MLTMTLLTDLWVAVHVSMCHRRCELPEFMSSNVQEEERTQRESQTMQQACFKDFGISTTSAIVLRSDSRYLVYM